jgi:hypothetical protein
MGVVLLARDRARDRRRSGAHPRALALIVADAPGLSRTPRASAFHRRREPMTDTRIAIDVPTLVADRIAGAAVRAITVLTREMTLAGDLGLSHPQFVPLAESLRRIVKTFNPRATIAVADIESDDATVGSTIDLVVARIGAL